MNLVFEAVKFGVIECTDMEAVVVVVVVNRKIEMKKKNKVMTHEAKVMALARFSLGGARTRVDLRTTASSNAMLCISWVLQHNTLATNNVM
ncbi:hypothetical protein F8388_005209 [Cannabis sativa]|uniref:Uncharacterized protein n=1 Tax=Cannabis sativa TaxID=3483 RepID=A0A7J6EN47_CANSA|nr:hypothetical protein F8388_005209 [Cannabis sativa]KAF4375046.1 hypothetical protein G4B88_004797 [Cannabis sativa]